MRLAVFQVSEVSGKCREVLARAQSRSDAAALVSQLFGLTNDDAENPGLVTITEVNYGDDFREAGPRGIIVAF